MFFIKKNARIKKFFFLKNYCFSLIANYVELNFDVEIFLVLCFINDKNAIIINNKRKTF